MQVKNKYQGFTKIGLVFAGLIVGLMLSMTYSAVAEKMVKPQLPIEDLRAFAEVFGKIKSDYVEPVEDKKLISEAISGMLTGLDPHSTYMDVDAFKDMQAATQGEFGGLGIEVGMEDGLVKVISPIEDSPAYAAGIKSGDLIMKLDEKLVKGMTLNDAVKIMRGKPDTLPADLALRVKAVLGIAHHDAADRGATRRVLEAARDIARRSSIHTDDNVSDEAVDSLCGVVLLSAYPDRLGMRRTSPGQFVMRGGGGVTMDSKDPIAREKFVVAADIDAQRSTSRLRRGAAVDIEFIATVLGDDVELESYLLWDKSRDDLVQRVVRKVGSIRIDERDLQPTAGDETTDALLERVRATNMAVLGNGSATAFRQRIAFLRHHQGDTWPETSNTHLLATLEEWLVPFLAGATSRSDLAKVDVTMVLQSTLGWDASSQLDQLAPQQFSPPRGQPVDINYTDPAAPMISIRVQHLYGVTTHPSVLNNTIPLRIQLLSPAQRPIQITADLPGFWKGSWAEVRKEMAGRYPKHDWPIDPSA